MSKARDYISDLAANGRYHFAADEMRKALGVSADAAKLSLYRLAKRGLVASPARGFYIIVPPEIQTAILRQTEMAHFAGHWVNFERWPPRRGGCMSLKLPQRAPV